MSEWKRLSEIVRVGSEWVALIGERWLCDKGQEREYWRVEKVDSVIVLPIQADQIFCVPPTFRPGVGRATLDLPGGRLPTGKQPYEIVPSLLERELGVPPHAIRSIKPLNADKKWLVNSAFSNQGLWAFAVEIDNAFEISKRQIGATARADAPGLEQLMSALDCLQCRAVLREWQSTTSGRV